MSTFEYMALDETGREISGVMDSPNEIHLLNHLTAKGYIVSSIKPRGEGIVEKLRKYIRSGGSRISKLDLIVFTRQMASLLNAGIPINSALRILSRQASSKIVSELSDEIRGELEGGSTITEALRKRKDVFSDSYLSMVEAGEASGSLPEVFDRLATLMEIDKERIDQVKSAITYPVILIIAALAGITFLIVSVFPTFIKIFSRANIKLPWTTRLLIALSDFVRANYPVILVVILVLALFVKFYSRTESGKVKIDELKLRLPIFGDIFKKVAMSAFAHNYRALNSSGIPIERTLQIVAGTVGNKAISRAILEARDKIKAGSTIASPFEESGYFPPLVVHMISTGEESGQMDEMLEKISDYYDKEVSYSIAKLTTLLEPMLLAVMGVVVGFMYLSLITPMMQIMKVAKAGGLG